MKNIIKIAITGGPCGGKTRAVKKVEEHFSEKGYGVILVPETATELIMGGISPWTCENTKTFQKYVLKMQLVIEELYEEAAQSLTNDNVLMIFDRGAMDGKAYLSPDEFDEILAEQGITEEEIIDRYDAVFHLVSAARGAEQHYSCRNNEARTEKLEEAAILDDKIREVWIKHPYFKVIASMPKLDKKIEILLNEMDSFLSSIGDEQIG